MIKGLSDENGWGIDTDNAHTNPYYTKLRGNNHPFIRNSEGLRVRVSP